MGSVVVTAIVIAVVVNLAAITSVLVVISVRHRQLPTC